MRTGETAAPQKTKAGKTTAPQKPAGEGTGGTGQQAMQYGSLISGEQSGPVAACARGLLRAASLPYRAAVAARNFWYDSLAGPRWLDIPVVSIGNITTGGTGKTPMVIWLCERLIERGRKVAVLSRGYKAADGLADELLLVSRRCPAAVGIAHPHPRLPRQMAHDEYPADVAVLDDGFQHRRLGRDLDIVLIDATCPAGHGHLLPRGLLREPLASLSRADVVVITRCDQAGPRAVEDAESLVRTANPGVEVLRAVHRPQGFVDLSGQAVQPPGASVRLGCLAGIARPEAVLHTLRSTELHVAAQFWFPDHQPYGPREAQAIRDWIGSAGIEALVTTEKDAVKLAALKQAWPVPVLVLRIGMDLLDDGTLRIERRIDELLAEWTKGSAHEHATGTAPGPDHP